VIVPGSISYDPLDAPDLYIRFAKSSSSQWDYKTPVVSDNYAFTAYFNTEEFIFTNESWE
jgi:hypothetical protein